MSTSASLSSSPSGSARHRYALCGLSNRAIGLILNPLLGRQSPDGASDLSGLGEVVAIVDIDAERIARFNQLLPDPIPAYAPDEFDRMIRERNPQTVLVTSPDYTHADYVVAALRNDRDVITEKPMAATAAQVRVMLEAERASSGSIRVAHNYRYTNLNRQLKRMMLAGKVGRVTNVELTWLVDSAHGSSYFHRWNRSREYSGGLSVHKSCHHFDLVNWLLDDVPDQVFAYGALNYYGEKSPHNPSNRDLTDYSVADQQRRCPFYRTWYPDPLERERVLSGSRTGSLDLPYAVQYPPDSPTYIYDKIDIEDTYSAVIRYRGGASVAYSVVFCGPWEGYRLGINGTHGRIEATTKYFRDRPDHVPAEAENITYYPLFGERELHQVTKAQGSHDGADPLLRHDLFLGESEESRELRIAADARQGAYAVGIGEAVWRSIRDGRPYSVSELIGELDQTP